MAEQIKILRLGAKGDGVGEDGTFVNGALPGEVVEGVVADGRMSAPKIMVPSPDRIRPPCPHAKSCGGCSLQHASDDFVAGWKSDQIGTALGRVGLTPEILPIATSGIMTRRRAALSGRRTKSGALVGFHSRSSDMVVAIPNCLLLTKTLLSCIPTLEEIVRKFGSRRGELTFHIMDTDTGVDVDVDGPPELDGEAIQSLAQIAERADFARLSWNRETVAARRQPRVEMGPALVPVPPRAFLQATRAGQETLVHKVLEIISGHETVVDLFAGSGTFSIPAAKYSEIHAVEGDQSLCAALDAGWRHAVGLKSITTEVRDLFRNPILAEDLKKYSAVIIDPPRAGAEAQVSEIAVSNVKKIAFVSCNPVTFARDARILEDAGFVCDWVQPVDQFRWSTHIELVASFTRS